MEKEWTISQYKPVIDQIVKELLNNKKSLDKIREETLFWILNYNNFAPEINNLIVKLARLDVEQVSLTLENEIEKILKDLSFCYDDKYLNDLINIIELTIRKLGLICADPSFVGLSVSLHIYNEASKILEERFQNKLPEDEQSLGSLFENEDESFPFFDEDEIHDLIMNGAKQILRNWNIDFNDETFSKDLEKFHYIDGEDSGFHLKINPFPWYS